MKTGSVQDTLRDTRAVLAEELPELLLIDPQLLSPAGVSHRDAAAACTLR